MYDKYDLQYRKECQQKIEVAKKYLLDLETSIANEERILRDSETARIEKLWQKYVKDTSTGTQNFIHSGLK